MGTSELRFICGQDLYKASWKCARNFFKIVYERIWAFLTRGRSHLNMPFYWQFTCLVHFICYVLSDSHAFYIWYAIFLFNDLLSLYILYAIISVIYLPYTFYTLSSHPFTCTCLTYFICYLLSDLLAWYILYTIYSAIFIRYLLCDLLAVHI